MSQDYIIDVLNDLDEDLILEANKRRMATELHHKKWIVPASVAASLCIVMSVFFYAGGFDLFAQNSENHIAMEDTDLHFSLQENLEAELDATDEVVQETPSVIVTLENRTEDGFIGTVTEIVDTDAVPLGSIVAVKTDSKTVLSAYSESEATEKFKAETSTTFPITVRVMFHPLKKDDSDDFAYDTEGIYYIYAEQIYLVEENGRVKEGNDK